MCHVDSDRHSPTTIVSRSILSKMMTETERATPPTHRHPQTPSGECRKRRNTQAADIPKESGQSSKQGLGQKKGAKFLPVKIPDDLAAIQPNPGNQDTKIKHGGHRPPIAATSKRQHNIKLQLGSQSPPNNAERKNIEAHELECKGLESHPPVT